MYFEDHIKEACWNQLVISLASLEGAGLWDYIFIVSKTIIMSFIRAWSKSPAISIPALLVAKGQIQEY